MLEYILGSFGRVGPFGTSSDVIFLWGPPNNDNEQQASIRSMTSHQIYVQWSKLHSNLVDHIEYYQQRCCRCDNDNN